MTTWVEVVLAPSLRATSIVLSCFASPSTRLPCKVAARSEFACTLMSSHSAPQMHFDLFHATELTGLASLCLSYCLRAYLLHAMKYVPPQVHHVSLPLLLGCPTRGRECYIDLQTLPSALHLPASQIPHAGTHSRSGRNDTDALRELFRTSSSIRGYRTASIPSGSHLQRERLSILTSSSVHMNKSPNSLAD